MGAELIGRFDEEWIDSELLVDETFAAPGVPACIVVMVDCWTASSRRTPRSLNRSGIAGREGDVSTIVSRGRLVMTTTGGVMDNGTDRSRSDSDRDPDPRVSSVPLPTEDGDEVVIAQQNVGPGNRVGAGEFKRPGEASDHKDPATAAEEQDELDSEAPVE